MIFSALEIVEGVERQPVRAADEHQPLQCSGWRRWYSSATARPSSGEQHGLLRARRLEHRLQIGGEVIEGDPRPVGGHAAAPVAAVVPAHDAVSGREIAHQVLPGESVAGDAVAADERLRPLPTTDQWMPCRLGLAKPSAVPCNSESHAANVAHLSAGSRESRGL